MKKIALMYHDVYRELDTESGLEILGANLYKINIAKFEEHVQLAHNYCTQKGIPKESIEFTFDDGGESFYSVIAPILEKYGFTGVFFISTAYIGSSKFLAIEQVKSLHDRGHVIASHSHSHPCNMTKLSVEELISEWETSIGILEQIIQEPVTVASIPSGFYSKKVVEAASIAGIKKLYTSKPTSKISIVKNITLIGRYVVHQNTTLSTINDIISNSWVRRGLFIRWMLVRMAKCLLGDNYIRFKDWIIRQ